jgi:hypothetical protein
MEITNEIRELLRAPLPSEAIKPHSTKSYLSTIKPIYVIERLSDVFGVGGWSVKTQLEEWFEKTNSKGKTEYTAVTKTVLTVPQYNIYHESIAGSSNDDLGDAVKGATTDGITKIGSYLEIGIDVFKGKSNPPPPPPISPNKETPKPKKKETLTESHKNWEYIKGRIAAGTPLETIKEHFTFTKEVEEKLLTK